MRFLQECPDHLVCILLGVLTFFAMTMRFLLQFFLQNLRSKASTSGL